MAGKKDVELRIRAQDDASKNVKKISDALKLLHGDADDASKGTGKLSGSLGGLSDDVQKLQREMDRLKAVGQIATEFNRSAQSVGKLETSVRGSAAELAKLARESDQASTAATRFKTQVLSEQAALDGNRRALSATKEELKQVNSLVRQAEKDWSALNAVRSRRAGGNIATSGVGLESGPATTSARDSMGAFVAADMAANRAAQSQLNNEVKNYQRVIEGSSQALKELRPQASAAAANQKRLADDTARAAEALRRQRETLGQARNQLSTIGAASKEASAAMGGMAVTQESVVRSSKRVEDQIARTSRAIEAYNKFSTGGGDFVNPRTAAELQRQAAIVNQLETDWRSLTNEAARLNGVMRTTSGNATEQVNAFNRTVGAARAAKTEYQAQINVLDQLRGKAGLAASGLASSAQQQAQAAQMASAAQSRQSTETERSARAQRLLAPAVRQTAAEMANAAGRTNSFNGALLGLGNGTRQSLSLMQRLRGEVLSLTASYVGFHAAIQNIGGSISAFRDLESIQSRLGAVFAQDTARVGQEVDWLRAEADRLGISLSVLGNQYAKFAVAADASNFSAGATRDIFLSVAEAARVNKLSLDQMQGTFLAIEQIISKGKFTSEEVRRQLGDRLPGAFSILASAMGVTTMELDKMMASGDLMATENNLLKFADEMTRRFGPQLTSSLDTVTTDIGRFENEIFKSQLRVSNGFIPALRDALQAFNEFSDSAEGRQFFTQLGVQVGRLITILSEVPKYFDLIAIAIQGFVAVKLAGFILDVTRRVGGLRTAFGGLSQQMAFVGPQMQQMSIGQRVLGQGFAQVIGAIDVYRARLLASTAATGTASMGTRLFASALGLLRGALMFTAGAARTLWAAFGGLPGIIATAVTFAIGSWITRVDDATAAITEHQRQVEALRSGYQAVAGDVDDWASKIEGVTLSMAQANYERIMTEWRQATDRVASSINQVRNIYDQWMATGRHDWVSDADVEATGRLIDLVDRFAEGSIAVEDFRTELDEINRSTAHEGLQNITLELQEMLDAAEEGGTSIKDLERTMREAREIVKVLSGEADETTEAILGLGGAVDEANDAFDNSAAIEAYTSAIDTLKSKIPSLADEMERLKNITELNKTAWEGFTAALSAGDFSAAAQIVSLWTQAGQSLKTEEIMSGLSGGGANASAALLRQFEGFETQPYWDTNAYRVGYGSDTVTLSDGSIQRVTQAMTVTRADAERDLARRIVEFQNVIRDQIGNERFESFGDPQQAVLTSIAYNYGSLPERIIDEIMGGDSNSIATAIRGLMDDNGGVNSGRRAQEAAIFAAGGDADITPMVEAERERLELQQEQAQATADRLAQNEFDISQQRLINDGRELQAEIERAIAEARKENPEITEAEIEQIRIQTEELYNLNNVVNEREAAEERVNQLYTLRQQLLEQLKMAEETGDVTQAQNLELRLGDVNTQLQSAIQQAIAMWRAVGGPEADAAIAKLQTMGMTIGQARNQMGALGLSMDQWGQLAGSFADGLVGVFDTFAQAIANGENAVQALGKAFLQFAADFLRQIAQMILKQMILNALQSFFPGLPIGHTGGIVGTKAIGGGNGRIAETPTWMRHALTYHTGGVAGLKPDEVNATLRVGEEILTEEDPRHRNNFGGDSPQRGGGSPSIKQVLVLDQRELSNAMRSRAGEEVVMTHIKSNAGTIRRLLGTS